MGEGAVFTDAMASLPPSYADHDECDHSRLPPALDDSNIPGAAEWSDVMIRASARRKRP
jgi:hypothetical protein